MPLRFAADRRNHAVARALRSAAITLMRSRRKRLSLRRRQYAKQRLLKPLDLGIALQQQITAS